MKFPGYWVTLSAEGAKIEKSVFDETDLDPATGWKEAWQNQDALSTVKGFVDLETALMAVRTHVSTYF